MERVELTKMVFALDILIVLGFVMYLIAMDYAIRRERTVFDVENLTVTDFALKIKSLPNDFQQKDMHKLVQKLRNIINDHEGMYVWDPEFANQDKEYK